MAADLGEECEEQVLKDMIYAADLDQDGKVSKDEFMMVMRKMKLIWNINIMFAYLIKFFVFRAAIGVLYHQLILDSALIVCLARWVLVGTWSCSSGCVWLRTFDMGMD